MEVNAVRTTIEAKSHGKMGTNSAFYPRSQLSPIRQAMNMALVASVFILLSSESHAAPGELTLVQTVSGLPGNPRWVEVSPNGAHVYVTFRGSRIILYSRDAVSGTVAFVEESASITDATDQGTLSISPDGAHVYAVSSQDDALAVYSRNAITGSLTYIETHTSLAGDITGGLDVPWHCAISPDGKNVYVAVQRAAALAVFSRNTTTGSLTPVEVLFNGVGGIQDMLSPYKVAVSPDSDHVYVVNISDLGLVLFDRNGTTGELTFVDSYPYAATAIGISPDGALVYVGRNLFSRDTISGVLSLIEVSSALNAPEKTVFSSDAAHVYTTAHVPGNVHVLERILTTGAVTRIQSFSASQPSLDIEHVTAVALSPDDRHVYVSAHQSGTLTVFSREPSRNAIRVSSPGVYEEGQRIEMLSPAGLSGYQWLKDGLAIINAPPRVTGADSPLLILDPAEVADTAVYSVLYDPGSGAAESLPRQIYVFPIGSLAAASPFALVGLVVIILAVYRLKNRRRNQLFP